MRTTEEIVLACSLLSFLAFFGYGFILVGTQGAGVRVEIMIILGLGGVVSLLIFLYALRKYLPTVYDSLMQSPEGVG